MARDIKKKKRTVVSSYSGVGGVRARSFVVVVPLFLSFWVGASLQAAVIISSPSNGATVASPVALSATTSSAVPTEFQVYDNGSLVLQRSGVSSITASLTLTAGPHVITVDTVSHRRSNGGASVTVNVSTPVSSSPPPGSTTVAVQISNDMIGQNEGFPHGVPSSYDWYSGPVIEMGNNANGWKAIEAWGTVYVASQGNPATNTRVNIRNMQTWFLSKSTGNWTMLQNTSTPDGAAYLEDFSGDINKPGDVRNEPDGTISVTAGGGYNYHFYPTNRASINPSDIGGIVTLFEVRLIVGNPALPDDRATANYLCNSGADYYPALTGGWPGNLSYNPGVAGGKFKYVTIPWRSIAMTTMSATALANNPPPIDLTGINP